jgi:hypothetical protein
MGVLVERCRYLEEAGCASICLNSCKVPTQVRSAARHARLPHAAMPRNNIARRLDLKSHR